MMNGDIFVSSKEGEGSIFTIQLPAVVQDTSDQFFKYDTVSIPSDMEISSVTDQSDLTSLHDKTILVVDDDPAIRDLMKKQLTKEGFTVYTATNGMEGLSKAREILPDIITLDVMMPGMDGWMVLSALKADHNLSHIPVVMVTIADDKKMGFTLGASDYITKPINKDRLLEILNKHQCNKKCGPVLIIEDDPSTRQIMRKMLEKEGWHVTEAENGVIGLEQIEKNQPEIILLDLMMPVMDGFEFTGILRENDEWKSIPIVVVTAKELSKADYQRLNGHVERILQKGQSTRDDLLLELKQSIANLTYKSNRNSL
jgi:CheY-like chemotaxis protein